MSKLKDVKIPWAVPFKGVSSMKLLFKKEKMQSRHRLFQADNSLYLRQHTSIRHCKFKANVVSTRHVTQV